MPLPATLRDAPFPLPPPLVTAEPTLAPNAAACARAALLRLLRLVLYVSTMLLLGYRIPRLRGRAARSAPRSSQPAQATPAALAAPRRKHPTIDRQMCLEALAGINSAFAASIPAAPAHPVPPPIAPRPTAAPRAASRPCLAPPVRPGHTALDTRLPRARPHPPPSSKYLWRPAFKHAHFVAIS
jgi:hypothetical protein